MKKKVLILCTGNSCRSQMAEGVMRHYGGHKFEVFSAGTLPSIVNQVAIQVMQEIGIDISGHRSKHVSEFEGKSFDYVITVCDYANQTCPSFLNGRQKIHWGFPDPPHDARQLNEKVIQDFRKVRDMIHERFKTAAENEL